MSQPLISIVVPTYNRAHLLPATLKSLQAQDYSDFEIIVVDDGSTDNTEEVVKSFLNSYTRYVKKENAERAAARNFGASIARGAFLNFFDSDDLALSNHTAEAAAMIDKHTNPEWFHLSYRWTTPEGLIFRNVNSFQGKTLNRQLAAGNCLSCNGVFIRRDILFQHPFNEDRTLSASEDYELWLRLGARYPLFFSNVITSTVIDHELRSVRTINGKILIDRLERLISYIEKDDKIIQFYGRSICRIRMDSLSYISLHLADQRSWKLVSIRYLLKALTESIELFTSKRFYAIIKNLIFKW